jgi:hypothetical protein
MRCQWAACAEVAVTQVDDWLFCIGHVQEHRALEDSRIDDLELELAEAQAGARIALSRVVRARQALAAGYQAQRMRKRLPLLECGTHAAFNRHAERVEAACDICVEGERIYQADLNVARKSVRV